MAVRMDHGEDELAENHEINVTPFIDVMLVLLIIFMVAAPPWRRSKQWAFGLTTATPIWKRRTRST